jgi:hypothetical protein
VALDFRGIRDRLVSHALASGHFDTVNAQKPTSVPNTGVNAMVEFGRMKRARGRAGSGLSATSVLLVVTVSCYLSAEQQPADDIDPQAVAAADALLAAYVGDFELGGTVRHIDVGASQGVELDAAAGWARVGGVDVRAVVVTVPMVVNDVWSEAA